MAGDAPKLRLRAATLTKRPWRLRLPFHYGDVTLTEAEEVHLALTVELADGRREVGHAAELAAPKWFEKAPDVTPGESADRLLTVAKRAVALALEPSGMPRSVAAIEAELREAIDRDAELAREGITALERSFGVALVERAAIDAVCRALGAPFDALVRSDLLGFEATLPDPTRAAYAAWRLDPARGGNEVAVRHTVGLGDPVGSVPWLAGRPVGLRDVIALDGLTSFKVKLPGQVDEAVSRLEELAAVLDADLPAYAVTLDANEAYRSADAFAAVVARLSETDRLRRFWASVSYIEQPLRRDVALEADLGRLGKPVIIDESDGEDGAFALALSRGYAGVSLKTCKGVLHGLRNVALARERGAFVTLEDLSVQPGVALAQNLALAACLGLPDCERNGHHYGPGPAALPAGERRAFQAGHPDLYPAEHGRLAITGGRLDLRSTRAAKGFGTAVRPDCTLDSSLESARSEAEWEVA